MSLRRKLMMRMGAAMMNRLNYGENIDTIMETFASGITFEHRDAFAKTPLKPEFITKQADMIVRTSFMWASAGFPLIVPTHKLTATFMASQVPDEFLSDIKMPWSAFALAVPSGMLGSSESLGALCEKGVTDTSLDTQHVVVVDTGRFGGAGISIVMQTEQIGTVSYVSGESLTDVLALSKEIDIESNTKISIEAESRTRRRICLIVRLVAGVCIELDQPKHRIVIGEGRPKEKREKRGEPKAWTFELKRDVRVDCREWVKDYIRGTKGTSPSVQTLVRGHHKRQPFGPENKERKWIHVEPYWRGPEDAPIAVRSHKLVGRESDPTLS